MEVVCPTDNPHSRMSRATRGRTFTYGPNREIDLVAGLIFHTVEKFKGVLKDFRSHFDSSFNKSIMTGKGIEESARCKAALGGLCQVNSMEA